MEDKGLIIYMIASEVLPTHGAKVSAAMVDTFWSMVLQNLNWFQHILCDKSVKT